MIKTINMKNILLRQGFAVLVLLTLLALMPGVARADQQEPAEVTGAELLDRLAVSVWQRLNEARSNPLAAAARLQIPEETVRIVFADSPWILDAGLPPLAWNAQLVASATAHNSDMLARLYYNYVSPEGVTFDQRIAATGYVPQYTGETINALFFENYLPLEIAFELLVDAMLRDELTGHTAVQRNIFHPELTEVGVSFRAEQSRLIRGLPYVYMVVTDFAAPVAPRQHLIGHMDQGLRLLLRSSAGGAWQEQDPAAVELAPGLFQLPVPATQVVTVASAQPGPFGTLVNAVAVAPLEPWNNSYVDLRLPTAVAPAQALVPEPAPIW